MGLYNIYHGLGGGFGGANYDYTKEFNCQEDADKEAYLAAWEDYESYEGCHGLRDWAQVAEDYMEEQGLNCLEELLEDDLEEIDCEFREEVEGWIDYYAIPTEEDTNITVEEIDML